MFVTNAAPDDIPRAMGILSAITNKECTTSRKISAAILPVSEGAVVGHAQMSASDAPPSQPPKKPGFFKRLFGKN
jgi:hypothetical protein